MIDSLITPRIRNAAADRMGYERDLDRAAGGIRMYWWEGFRTYRDSLRLLAARRSPLTYNFGDLISPLVVHLVSGRTPVYSNSGGKLLALGTAFRALRSGDTVWGTGLLGREELPYIRNTKDVTFAAVRGPKTRALLREAGFDCPAVFGDIATLLPLYVENDLDKRFRVGVVPHWTQLPEFKAHLPSSTATLIDVTNRVDLVIKQILQCDYVIATSLHGLVVAEAYGIPARLLVYRRPVRGNLHKYEDYFLSTGREIEYDTAGTIADVIRLCAAQNASKTPSFELEPLLKAFPCGPVKEPGDSPSARWSTYDIASVGCFR